jgi:hypothetical protein
MAGKGSRKDRLYTVRDKTGPSWRWGNVWIFLETHVPSEAQRHLHLGFGYFVVGSESGIGEHDRNHRGARASRSIKIGGIMHAADDSAFCIFFGTMRG